MNASLFDATTFLDQTVTGAMDTKYPLIPSGEWPALAKSLTARKQPAKDPTKPDYTVLDIVWSIEDAGVKEATKLDNPTCRQSVFLDLDENGLLDLRPTKNVQLGRLREALGLNKPDVEFSFAQIVGQPSIVKVEHSPNPTDPDNPYSNVTKVVSA